MNDLMPQRYDTAEMTKLKLIIVGASGMGKTRMAIATLPPEARVLIFSTERGLLSVKNELAERKGYLAYKITSFLEVEALLDHYREKKTKPDYIVVDSLTELGNMILHHGKVNGKKQGYDLWGYYNETFEGIMKDFFEFPESVFIGTALEEVEQLANGEVKHYPSMDGKKYKADFLGQFDAQFFLRGFPAEPGPNGELRRDEVFAITETCDGCPGKNRTGNLAVKEPPHLTHIIYKMLGKVPGWRKQDES